MSEPVIDKDTNRWQAPAIDGGDGRGYLTANRLQELQREAREEAWQEGYAEGLEAGSESIRLRVERFDELLSALAKPFEELEESVEMQLVDLAVNIARQLFRREIQIDPTHVVGVVREAVPMLPVASRDIVVHLHPEDAEIVQQSFADAGDSLAWRIEEDPLVARGGCLVSSDCSNIDALAETRFQAIVDAIVGDERAR